MYLCLYGEGMSRRSIAFMVAPPPPVRCRIMASFYKKYMDVAENRADRRFEVAAVLPLASFLRVPVISTSFVELTHRHGLFEHKLRKKRNRVVFF